MGTYRDPSSDNDATNPLNDAPEGADVLSQQDGHIPNEIGDKARNVREC